MRILHLTISREWFNLIASGLKPEEYRKVKPYWTSRLIDNDFNFIQYDEIHFHNGPHFGADLPLIRIRHTGTRRVPADFVPANGERLEGRQYGLMLGEILEVRK